METWKAWYADWRRSANNAGSAALLVSPSGEIFPSPELRGKSLEMAVLAIGNRDSNGRLYFNDGYRSFFGEEFSIREEAEQWVADQARDSARSWSGWLRNVAPHIH